MFVTTWFWLVRGFAYVICFNTKQEVSYIGIKYTSYRSMEIQDSFDEF